MSGVSDWLFDAAESALAGPLDRELIQSVDEIKGDENFVHVDVRLKIGIPASIGRSPRAWRSKPASRSFATSRATPLHRRYATTEVRSMTWFRVAEQIEAFAGPIVSMRYHRHPHVGVDAIAYTASLCVSYSETGREVRWQIRDDYDVLATGIDKKPEAPGLISAIKNLK